MNPSVPETLLWINWLPAISCSVRLGAGGALSPLELAGVSREVPERVSAGEAPGVCELAAFASTVTRLVMCFVSVRACGWVAARFWTCWWWGLDVGGLGGSRRRAGRRLALPLVWHWLC